MYQAVIGIDPGPIQSAVAIVVRVKGSGDDWTPIHFGIARNETVREWLTGSLDTPLMAVSERWGRPLLAVEQVKCYGMAVGDDVLFTVFWSGRFVEAWNSTQTDAHNTDAWVLIPRKTVVTHLCHDATAKDTNVRQRLRDLYGGTRRKGALLYGCKDDMWSALAVALTAAETQGKGARVT